MNCIKFCALIFELRLTRKKKPWRREEKEGIRKAETSDINFEFEISCGVFSRILKMVDVLLQSFGKFCYREEVETFLSLTEV